jgi:hypothetical protein
MKPEAMSSQSGCFFHFLFPHFAGDTFGCNRPGLEPLKRDFLATRLTYTVGAIFNCFQRVFDFLDEPAFPVPYPEKPALIFIICRPIQGVAHGLLLGTYPHNRMFPMGQKVPKLITQKILKIFKVSFFHRICPHTGKTDLLGLAPHFEYIPAYSANIQMLFSMLQKMRLVKLKPAIVMP